MISGNIEINNREILYWRAVRREPLTDDPSDKLMYTCTVYHNSKMTEFEVFHAYKDGGTALAAQVLSKSVENGIGEPPRGLHDQLRVGTRSLKDIKE